MNRDPSDPDWASSRYPLSLKGSLKSRQIVAIYKQEAHDPGLHRVMGFIDSGA